jgi:hypothetical protein
MYTVDPQDTNGLLICVPNQNLHRWQKIIAHSWRNERCACIGCRLADLEGQIHTLLTDALSDDSPHVRLVALAACASRGILQGVPAGVGRYFQSSEIPAF